MGKTAAPKTAPKAGLKTGSNQPGKVITRTYIRDFFRLEDKKQDNDILEYIMAHLILKEYKHDSFICRAGELARTMYFVEAGVVNVLGSGGEAINELREGRYFGEYATLTEDKRMADVRANGTVLVYEFDRKALSTLIRMHPKIYGLFLKQVYDQATERYRNLVRILNLRRGLGASRSKKLSPLSLFINYSLVFLIFYNLLIWAPPPAEILNHPFWMCSPLMFLVGYMVVTRQALEALILSVLYIALLLSRFGFISFFTGHVVSALRETPDLILMVAMMGALTKLFSASGSINALKHLAEKRIKSGRGILFAAFCAMILTAIDEYLMILINGACFSPLADQKKIAREKSSMALGMTPMALCILNPLSLTGIYLTGIIASSGGAKELFIQGIRFNFAALTALVFMLLLIIGLLPRVGLLRQALERVKAGGPLWPAGTDNSGDSEDANQGRILNLVLPIAVLIVCSVVFGTLQEGSLSVNVLDGMIVALLTAFLLYCFQHYMTPEQFFNNIVRGVESMLAPLILFVMGKCFASGIEELGFSGWLNGIVNTHIGAQGWLLPAIVFGICTFIGAIFDNPWAMYAIGMPIAINLAASTGGNLGLFVGAVCSAGFVGNELALGDIFFIGPMLGINPITYYRTKLPYVIAITALAFAAYSVTGYLLTVL
ncbi:MAG: cyclic nucleotide-binding domain-containing protein [Spirochaetaceae bacterium]|jgi:Na+/H+ antiporter NhaC|nr:cyclic nucleotide-binding domain-containing protein [Spirochaetaceae bacterium]